MNLKKIFSKKEKNNERRKYPRYNCSITSSFLYYEGNPEEIDFKNNIPRKGKGYIIDISEGGAFIVTNELLTIQTPIVIKGNKNLFLEDLEGTIIRTGRLAENPSELARKYANEKLKGTAYLAIKFNESFLNAEKIKDIIYNED